ncbi:MAG: hypothetical protein ABI237_08490 [Ginsengibacter sp.]
MIDFANKKELYASDEKLKSVHQFIDILINDVEIVTNSKEWFEYLKNFKEET